VLNLVSAIPRSNMGQWSYSTILLISALDVSGQLDPSVALPPPPPKMPLVPIG
jgi:hypothetical protein